MKRPNQYMKRSGTINSSIIGSSCDGSDTKFGRVTIFVCYDSANNIYIRLPNIAPIGSINYQYYQLNQKELNYPQGNIKEINCAVNYTDSTGVLFQISVTTDIDKCYMYEPTYVTVGKYSYSWGDYTPINNPPILPNPF